MRRKLDNQRDFVVQDLKCDGCNRDNYSCSYFPKWPILPPYLVIPVQVHASQGSTLEKEKEKGKEKGGFVEWMFSRRSRRKRRRRKRKEEEEEGG